VRVGRFKGVFPVEGHAPSCPVATPDRPIRMNSADKS